MQQHTTTALVAPNLDGRFEIRTVHLTDLRPDEVLVEIHASGICHTDLSCAAGMLPCGPNAVLGHEGAGIVLEFGSQVTTVSKSDKVLLSFSYCGTCPMCKADHPAYCHTFNDRNFGGTRPDGSTALHLLDANNRRVPMHSSFFGQSSFAAHAVVHKSCVVKVGPDSKLDLLAPLGCGIQTGVGAVLHTLGVQAGRSIAVFGAGSVGMAAIMGAKMVGASTIIAIDLKAERLDLARRLGATHGVLGSGREEVVAKLREICPPLGVDYALDCTGVPAVVEMMIEALGMRGRAATVGAPGGEAVARVNIMKHLTFGKEYVGCSEGDSNPAQFLPYLVKMQSEGRLPLEKLVTFYDFADWERAISDMKSGRTIKAVLRWA